MTAAHGLGWPGQPRQEGAASGDEVPPGAGPTGRAEPTGLDPASAGTAAGRAAARGEWPGAPWPGADPGDDIASSPGADGLGWPPAAPPPGPPAGMVTARPGGAAPEPGG